MKSFCGNFKGDQRCSPAFFFLEPRWSFPHSSVRKGNPGKAESRDDFPFLPLNEGSVPSQIIFLELGPQRLGKVSGWWQKAEMCLVNPLLAPPICCAEINSPCRM